MTPIRITMEQYVKMDALGSGTAFAAISQSPYHAKWQRENDEYSKEADVGTCAHQVVLEGSENGIEIIDANDWRKAATQGLRDAAYKASKTPILAGKMDDVRAMVAAARDFVGASEIKGVFDDGEPELTFARELDGVSLKIRPDWWNEGRGILLHYKTTPGSAEPNSWIRRQLVPSGYAFAAMFYEHVMPYEVVLSVFLVQESEPPYACSLISLDPALRDLESRRVERAITLWRDCTQANQFPAYPSHICYAQAKPWQLAEEEEVELNSAFSKKELEGGIPL